LSVKAPLPEGIPYLAVSFISNDGKNYSYMLSYNMRSNSVDESQVDLQVF